MATLEKLSKALETLKTLRNTNQIPEENYAKSKEKVNLAISLADLLCSPETRATTNFTPHLSFAMESLFYLCDDSDSNVRMVADECLNRIIRTLMDGHVGKVNLELHVEIKRNRKARSLRAALVKFAELAHTIRPNKRKVYIQNLVPCILKIAQRKEELVMETLASSLSKILVTLGCFMTDNDVKELLQVFLKNIENENAVFRRTAATSILAVCLNCHKSQLFIVHTINTLLETVIPIKEDQNIFMILGVLNCIRGLFGHLDGKNTDTGLRGSFGQKRKQKKEPVLAIDSLIQVFELCLHLTQHEDHNIVTAALETLNELLTTPPALLLPVLFNQQGLSRSRIHSCNVSWKLSTRTLSDISVATTVPISEDMSLFESEDFSLHQEDLGTWFNDGSNTESQLNHLVLDKDRPASVSADAFQDYPDGDSVMSDELGSLTKSLPFQSSEPDIYLARESPSPPLNSIQPMTWDIGELTDGSQSPLLFTARRLVTRFLIPECGNSRVSVRSLALMCLSQVLRLQPSVFFEPVDKNGLSTPKGFSHICDVICFAEDSDQQLRGHCRLLIAHLIQSLFNQALFETHFEEKLDKVVSIEKLMDIMLNGIQDESSVCVRHSLMALLLCLPVIMESSYYALVTPILNKLLAVTQNPYWLVKVHLIELFCSLPYQCVYFMTGNTIYQSKVFDILIGDFLSDEDNRVRKTACEGIMKIVKNLYYPVDYGTDDVVVARGVELVSMMFSDILIRGRKKPLFGTVIEENTLSRVVDVLVETLMASSSKNLSYGCIEALCNLSEEYEPSLYPDSWQCRDNSTEKEPTSAGGVFSLIVTLLTNSYISLDLECHQWLLKLASNLFKGLLHHHLKQRNDQLAEKSRLMASIDELLIHLMRLMSIFVNVVEDNVQPRNLLSSPLKKRQPPRPNSPSKIPLLPVEKESEKDEKIRVIGFYGNTPQCLKLYEIIRSGYTNYKLTLDRVASKKFLSLISHTLGCLEVMLTPNNIIDSEKMFEELLQYLRVTFILDSEATVKVVHELLRSLFEMNLLGIQMSNLLEIQSSHLSLPNGYYENIFNNPLKQLSELLHSPGAVSTEGGTANEKVKPHTACDRAVLASRIKLFEGIVIQSLKEYTITCNVKLQAQVLRLLTLLVQLKVNYCLLDSDQIFIDFVLKQFEFLEAGQIHDAEFLIPTIFQFLVHLSNEKNHSKPVISIPKIIQLCDGLMASGQNPVTHCIPALLPVVEHVFFKSTNVTDPKDLETQKEVLLVMLLRLAEYPQVLDTIHNLLKDGKKDEEHWSKWYKQTMDAIFPLLSEGRLLVTNISSLHSLFCLNKSFVAPLSNVLTLLFTPQQEAQTFTQWLGMVTVCLLSLCMHQEEEVLLQLEQMNLYVREEGDDPLKVNTVSKTLPPQSLLAKLLFRITVTSVLKLKSLIQCQLKDENVSELEKAFSSFLLCCAFMFKPDNFCKVSNSLSILLSDSADLPSIISSFELVMHRCQLPVLLWAQVMVLLHHSDRSSWHSFMSLNKVSESFKPKCSLNQELIRRGTIMLYADYLSTRMKDTKSLQWFLSGYIEDVIWHCHELPVEKLLSIICTMDLNSKILLDSISKCINIMEPVRIYRLLHTLEYINPVYSGAVLKLVSLSLIKYKNIAIARLAAAFCSRTIELILTLSNVTTLKDQLTEDELKFIFQSLSSHQKLCKRHSGLISLLNKLGKQCYNISLTESDDSVQAISPELIKSIKLDKSWFFNLVKEKCCSPLEGDTHRCAYLLSKLESNDLEKVMSLNEFNMDILKHCFSSGSTPSDQVSDEFGSVLQSSPLHNTAKKILLKLIRNICQTLPSSYQVFDPEKTPNHDLFKFLQSEKSMKTFYSLVPAVTNLLFNSKEISVDFGNLFGKDDIASLSRFGVLCIEVINWILIEEKKKNIKHCPSKLQALLKCSSYIFKTDVLSASLSLEQISSICCALLNIFQFILGEDIVLKEHVPPTNDGNLSEDVPAIAKTAIQMVSMITLIEKNPPNIPWCIFKNARSIIISLGREAKLNWLCRIPVEAWRPPLDCPTPPTLPPMLLHDTDILSQIVSRIRFLGWRGKFQFEESWVCLLGALTPNPDFEDIDQEEIDAMMQAKSLAIDGITWLAISTLSEHSHSVDDTKYLHVPRHSNERLYTLKRWKRLSKMNDLLCKKLKNISGNDGIDLLRIDERPNLERANNLNRYGFAQFSVPYLEAQIKYGEEGSVENDSLNIDSGYRKYLTKYGIDIRSCIQFILDLFPQWILPGIEISLNLQFSMIKAVLCISDMFTERSHFEWMLETFLELAKNQSVQDEIILQYLVIGIAKSCAVLSFFDGEVSDKILKIIESALKSQSLPLAEAGLHGLLYLLQGVKNIEKPVDNIEMPKLRPQEFRQRILQYSIEFIQKKFNSELDLNENMSLLLIALIFYILEYYPEEVADKQELIKLLIDLAKTTIDNTLYQTILQGFERLVLLGDGTFNEQITRLALNRYSKSDPKVTIPAFQLLLACIYANGNKSSGDDNDDNQQIELMEKVTILFDRIKKGYPVEVEIVCDVLPGILADFFSASDILTKVIGEFLSPNQPHKANMAAMVFQVFSQACSEQQLSLLQDWVVYSLGNLTHNIPKMMAAWSLCCFFISASTNPWLKAILPIVQYRMRQCEYEDRQILCLATVDFYQQLNSGQQKNFVQSLKTIGSSQASPFFDLLSCL
ncbi:unnamed protein product [Nezara viridula]|uniref:Huntingtin n=1 Tax=Nezara viridula TaxID=85310 RepID=A0A9P0HN76_NEZVI|nr:unnamed protein product [Nezara viridula]